MEILFQFAGTLDDLKHDCNDHLEQRERSKGKGTAYVNQCMFCGEQRGSDIAKSLINKSLLPFDDDIHSAYINKRKGIFEKIYPNTESVPAQESKHSIFQRELNAFLDDFKTRHGEFNETNIFSGYLNRQREKTIKGYPNLWKSEKNISCWFEKEFSKWFDIYPEVKGYGFVNQEKRNIRIDFVIKARRSLIDCGFTDCPIGIEVKFIDPRPGHGFHGKSSRGVFQAISYWYSNARWYLNSDDSEESLATILVLSNFSFPDDRNYIFNSYDKHYQKYWRAYFSIANHANIGELRITDSEYGWDMHYAGSNYFNRKIDGKFSKPNNNLIDKKRIGNNK